MRVVGIDGCRGGWLAVAYDLETRAIVPRVHPSLADALSAYPHAPCIAVDVPIGLTSDGPRPCDVAARRVLGPRRSSVFPAPDLRLLDAATFEQASELSRSLTGKGISIQSFGIYPQVAEANRLMTPLLQNWVIEVYPEVSFWARNDERPMAHPKQTAEGHEERRALLSPALDVTLSRRGEARNRPRSASADDFLDALVAAWTARRAALGIVGRLPEQPTVDANGLRMEMVY